MGRYFIIGVRGNFYASRVSATGGVGSSRRTFMGPPDYQNGKPSSGGLRNTQISDSWGVLKGALIGLAGLKVRDAFNQAIPGFAEQYDKMQRQAGGQDLNLR